MARLAALVPRPRANLTRYHGIFAPLPGHHQKEHPVQIPRRPLRRFLNFHPLAGRLPCITRPEVTEPPRQPASTTPPPPADFDHHSLTP